jgi:hypothetical protein
MVRTLDVATGVNLKQERKDFTPGGRAYKTLILL